MAQPSSKSQPGKLVNQLAKSKSPYVRGHADNATAWQLWNDDSLNLAKTENKLIFLSIGYAACHWCHVMERESFQDASVAEILNSNFVPIKVDREERPDIDKLYMNYVQATTGSGGWPLNVFLTPDLKPVFGGTYWPGPSALNGPTMRDQIGFIEVLNKLVKVRLEMSLTNEHAMKKDFSADVFQSWTEQEERCLASAQDIVRQLKEFADEGSKGNIDDKEHEDGLEIDLLEEAYQHFSAKYDPVFGGFGIAPKFPTPANLAFLLRLASFPGTVEDVVGDMECVNARDMTLQTLKLMYKRMKNGGIHDHIGHGFARYSVTPDWSLPHFEKMLYDNAQLLSVYLDAWLVSQDTAMLDTALDCADYLCLDALKNKEGGFFSSEDADSYYRKGDSEKREGAFYVWDRKEFTKVLGEDDADICAAYWNVLSTGNVDSSRDAHDEFINQNVLAISMSVAQLSRKFGLPETKILEIIERGRQKLRQYRNSERPRPNLDDKIVTSWNGLAIGSLARLASALDSTAVDRSKAYLQHAIEAADFIHKHLHDPSKGTLRRVYREGPGETPGFADDYAYLIQGLIYLYEATFDVKWLQWAHELQCKQSELFWDKEHGAFFNTESGATDLILRLKDGMDSAEPSTNGASAHNLYRLGTILDDESLTHQAYQTCIAFSTELLQHPFLFSSMLSSVVASNLGSSSVIMAGLPDHPDIIAFKERIRKRLLSHTTIVYLNPNDVQGNWLLEKNSVLKAALVDTIENPRIQICQGTRCVDTQHLDEFEAAFAELG